MEGVFLGTIAGLSARKRIPVTRKSKAIQRHCSPVLAEERRRKKKVRRKRYTLNPVVIMSEKN